MTELKDCALWWNGPEWLQSPREYWPSCDIGQMNKDDSDVEGSKIMFETGLAAAPDPSPLHTPWVLTTRDFHLH